MEPTKPPWIMGRTLCEVCAGEGYMPHLYAVPCGCCKGAGSVYLREICETYLGAFADSAAIGDEILRRGGDCLVWVDGTLEAALASECEPDSVYCTFLPT